jgi:hypothetical protein
MGVLAVMLLTFGTACSSDSGQAGEGVSDGTAEGACPNAFSFKGKRYVAVANLTFHAAEKAGTASRKECDDSGRRNSIAIMEEQPAFRVDGVSPSVAIAVGSTADTAKLFLSDEIKGISEEIRNLPSGK